MAPTTNTMPGGGSHWFARGLRTALNYAGFTVLIGSAMALIRDHALLALAMVVAMPLLAVIVHEGGHYLGARWAGMTVLQVRVGPLLAVPTRSRWRFRRLRGPRGEDQYGGWIQATYTPDRAMRGQHLRMIAMGPGANLLVATVCMLIGLDGRTGAWQLVAFGFGALNLGIALANLVPVRDFLHSDGQQLLDWLRPGDESRAELAWSRILAYSVAGTPAHELPARDLAQLEQLDPFQRLLAIALRQTASLNLGQWQDSIRYGEAFEAAIVEDPTLADVAPLLVAAVGADLDFVRCMVARDPGLLWDGRMDDELEWWLPWLEPRHRALRAALAGDGAECKRQLALAQQHADDNVQRAQGASERMIGEWIHAARQPTADAV